MGISIVIGTHGQVGQALIHSLKEKGERVVTTSRRFSERTEDKLQFFLDLQNPASIKQFFHKFSQRFSGERVWVFLTGALTHVDRCEQEPKLAIALNADGPMAVADECQRLAYKLLFYSSEYVFGGAEYEGGKVGPFTESDSVFPTSVYGKTKLTVEKKLMALLETLPANASHSPLAVRTTMVFSYEPEGMNFVMQVRRQLEKVRQGGEISPFRVPRDQISTPTYAPDLALASIQLMEKGACGVFHLVGTDLLSREKFVAQIASAYGFTSAEVAKGFVFVNTAELGQSARRPLTAGLSIQAAEKLGIKMKGISAALADMQKREKEML